nr:MAG: RNA-dependent RNA polymerase [Skomarfal virus 39]
MYCHFDNPFVYLIDHSKFDSRVNWRLLRMEHRFYLNIFPDPFLEYLLKFQINNKGRSRNGLKYQCLGRRMSGDANTALGNCVINYALLRIKFGPLAIIYLDGDDSVVFTEHIVNDLNFEDTGMVSKIQIVRHFQEIEFCQARPVMTSLGWLMCREPMRALNRALWKLGTVPKDLHNYLATIGIGEGLCSPEMPIISVISKVYRSLGGKYKIHYSQYRPDTMACVKKFLMPTHSSRVSFANAFDLDVKVQICIENEILDAVLLRKY